MKKISLLFIVVLFFSVASLYAQNDSQFEPENRFTVVLTKDGTGAVITGYTGTTPVVRIPPTIQGMPVREIGERAFYDYPASFRSRVGSKEELYRVVIPEGVIKIGREAFRITNEYWIGFASMQIPEGVTEIGENAFAGNPNKSGSPSNKGGHTLCNILMNDGRIVGHNLRISNLTLPQSLTTLGNGAYAKTDIRVVTLPAGLINIGIGVFEGCKSLQTVTLPEGMTSIPAGMFDGSTALNKINIPDSIIEIGANAFSNCRSLRTITLPASIRAIGARAFSGTGIGNITIPTSITKIEDRTFKSSSLQTITLPTSIKEIGWEAFSDCESLTTITIPESVTKINFGQNAFSGCANLNLATQARLKQLGYTDKF